MPKAFYKTSTPTGTLSGGGSGTLYFLSVGSGGLSVQTAEAWTQRTFRTQGTLSNLYVRVTTKTGADSIIVMRTNGNTGVDGRQTPDLNLTATGEFEDTTNHLLVNVGDKVGIALYVPPSATIALSVVSVLFDSANLVSLLNTAPNVTIVTGNRYSVLAGEGTVVATSEAAAKVKCGVAGTLKNLYVYVSVNDRTTDCEVDVRINGANSGILISIPPSTTGIFEDLTHTAAVAVGDLVNYIQQGA